MERVRVEKHSLEVQVTNLNREMARKREQCGILKDTETGEDDLGGRTGSL